MSWYLKSPESQLLAQQLAEAYDNENSRAPQYWPFVGGGGGGGGGESPSQRASNAENVSMSWRHYETKLLRSTYMHMFWCILLWVGMTSLIHSQTSTAAAVEVWERISNFIPHFMIWISHTKGR